MSLRDLMLPEITGADWVAAAVAIVLLLTSLSWILQ